MRPCPLCTHARLRPSCMKPEIVLLASPPPSHEHSSCAPMPLAHPSSRTPNPRTYARPTRARRSLTPLARPCSSHARLVAQTPVTHASYLRRPFFILARTTSIPHRHYGSRGRAFPLAPRWRHLCTLSFARPCDRLGCNRGECVLVYSHHDRGCGCGWRRGCACAEGMGLGYRRRRGLLLCCFCLHTLRATSPSFNHGIKSSRNFYLRTCRSICTLCPCIPLPPCPHL
ncbi:hypothetical protein K438DRAFT_528441 [Mycena galopus ATCC 62051]|nr:hypothetical protein K438DRAFT_528441 [Mycena galopus ATCC 62051]